MKKLIFTLLLTLGFANLIYAQATEGSKAVISFEKEAHNFGKLPEGPQGKVDFIFKNTGTEPVILTNVTASCGCTTPEWTKEQIMPGKSGKVTAIYNTQGRPGNFTKTITVTSNAGTKYLTISGEVVKSVMDDIPSSPIRIGG